MQSMKWGDLKSFECNFEIESELSSRHDFKASHTKYESYLQMSLNERRKQFQTAGKGPNEILKNAISVKHTRTTTDSVGGHVPENRGTCDELTIVGCQTAWIFISLCHPSETDVFSALLRIQKRAEGDSRNFRSLLITLLLLEFRPCSLHGKINWLWNFRLLFLNLMTFLDLEL
jgi:hypothetical protein